MIYYHTTLFFFSLHWSAVFRTTRNEATKNKRIGDPYFLVASTENVVRIKMILVLWILGTGTQFAEMDGQVSLIIRMSRRFLVL